MNVAQIVGDWAMTDQSSLRSVGAGNHLSTAVRNCVIVPSLAGSSAAA